MVHRVPRVSPATRLALVAFAAFVAVLPFFDALSYGAHRVKY